MYDHIRGPVVDKQAARAVICAGGVGYELKVSLPTSSSLAVGEDCQLFTILHVVDGNPTLLGFATKTERSLARKLLSVSGVGPAMTLAILSTWSPGEVAGAIIGGESAVLQRVKGVGARTAERLCLELRDQVAKMDLNLAPGAGPTLLPQTAEDAVAALLSLGYTEKEASKRVNVAYGKLPDADTEALIKSVLRG